MGTLYSANVRPVDMAHYLIEKDDILPSVPPPSVPAEKPARRAKEKSKPSLLSQPAKLKSQRPSQMPKTLQLILDSSSEDEDFNRQYSQYSQKPKFATSTQARVFYSIIIFFYLF